MIETLTALLDAAPDHHGIPSVSAQVRVRGRTVFAHSAGHAQLHPTPKALAHDPIYDLASITKALVGATVTAALVSKGALDPNEPIAATLPWAPAGVTATHLLQHAGGFPAWQPLYEQLDASEWGSTRARRALRRAAAHVPLQSAPGAAHTYSDIGFIVLLDYVEILTGHRIDHLFAHHVLEPAGLQGLTWGHPDATSTEDCPVRGRVLRGEVHDLNAAALGGVSTHAGLFGRASDAALLAEALLHPPPRLRALADTLHAWWCQPAPGTHRGGWDTITTDGYTSTGRWFPPDAVGHLGYTGTSLWMSPSRDAIVVLLTNRIHPRDTLEGIRAFRPRFHDAAAAALGWAPHGEPRA